MATILSLTRCGLVLMLSPKYELDGTTRYWVIAIFNMIRYVTLWPWPLTLESCHVMPLWWSIHVLSLNWIRLTVPELGWLQCSIDRKLKVPIFTFFGEKSQISNFIFLIPKKTTLARTTYNDVLRVEVCPEMRPVGLAKKRIKGQKLSCVKLAICPDHPRWHRPLKFCMRGHIRELVIYFNFVKIGWGVSELWMIENRPLPLTRPMAYTTVPNTDL